ncbi:MAG: tRNA adenosine(34) deaminase TadA [Pseudomonadota bacterium]|jgi:tRNA(adenine34) deaminase
MILVANRLQPLSGNNLSDIDNNLDLHNYYMGYALQLAHQALAFDEVPVGAIVVCNTTGYIIGMGHNKNISDQQTFMHAEMMAIQNACIYFNNYRLPNCRIYVTLEPCAMCSGAIIHARFSDIIFGASDKKTGMAGGLLNLFDLSINHQTKVTYGILENQSKDLIQSFFKAKRNSKRKVID